MAANGELKLNGDFRSVLNVDGTKIKPRLRTWSAQKAKEIQKAKKIQRFNRATDLFNNDANYRALHLIVARLFAYQLKADAETLKSGKNLSQISLAAKWAPSPDEFQDKHTWVVGSITELLYSHNDICPHVDKNDRAQYLMFARWSLRKLILSPLRQQLEIVERNISANTFDKINYERVPSLAMEKHQGTFAKKDEAHFNDYLDKVASGFANISGAILLPSLMVHKVRKRYNAVKKKSVVQRAAELRVMEGQWKSIVKRIRESGTISSAIAVCDVSGSMDDPTFPDGTNPMCSAIGLSLLLAEVVDGPFGGHIITFHSHPSIVEVGGPTDQRSFCEKVDFISRTDWGMNTDFVAVFEKLILPVAIENKIKPEDMIKQVFVFSDMQFDEAANEYDHEAANEDGASQQSQWSSSFERVKGLYSDAGYEMPTLVFWNLAGSREIVSKPVTAEEPGTALVSGYSQGQLKMFLDGGKFDDLEMEETMEDADMREGEDEDMVDVRVKKKQKTDPLITVKRAISHLSYAMLKVVD